MASSTRALTQHPVLLPCITCIQKRQVCKESIEKRELSYAIGWGGRGKKRSMHTFEYTYMCVCIYEDLFMGLDGKQVDRSTYI